jgi:hypothetical protein
LRIQHIINANAMQVSTHTHTHKGVSNIINTKSKTKQNKTIPPLHDQSTTSTQPNHAEGVDGVRCFITHH